MTEVHRRGGVVVMVLVGGMVCASMAWGQATTPEPVPSVPAAPAPATPEKGVTPEKKSEPPAKVAPAPSAPAPTPSVPAKKDVQEEPAKDSMADRLAKGTKWEGTWTEKGVAFSASITKREGGRATLAFKPEQKGWYEFTLKTDGDRITVERVVLKGVRNGPFTGERLDIRVKQGPDGSLTIEGKADFDRVRNKNQTHLFKGIKGTLVEASDDEEGGRRKRRNRRGG